jgi:PAS domain S-box-containing protein
VSNHTIQSKLDELRQQFGELRHFSRANPVEVRESLGRFLATLQESLAEVRRAVAHAPDAERAGNRAAANPGSNGDSHERRSTGSNGAASDGEHDGDLEFGAECTAEARLELVYSVARCLTAAATFQDAAQSLLRLLVEGLEWDAGEFWSVEVGPTGERSARLDASWLRPGAEVATWQVDARTHASSERDESPVQGVGASWGVDAASDRTRSGALAADHACMRGLYQLPILVDGEVRVVLRLTGRDSRPRAAVDAEFLAWVGAQIGQLFERERLRATLSVAQRRKHALLEASLDAIVTVDMQGCVAEFNAVAERMFGYRREQVLGTDLLESLVPPRMRERAREGLAVFREVGTSALPGKRFDASACRADGSEFPVEVALTSSGGEPALLTIYVRDATARKENEHRVEVYQNRLRALTAELLITEEFERRRLAVDLHDGLSQLIALAQMKLSIVRRAAGSKHATALDEVEDLIEQVNRAARSISFELSPPVLHDFGLEPALQWLVENIQSRYGIEIRLVDDRSSKPTDEKTRVILFRSIRELLINAAKHSRAQHVDVAVQREFDRLSIVVADDGVGMEPNVVVARGSGLFSIRERLNHVGGSMRIESAPGRGTQIHLCAPIAHAEAPKNKVEV